MHNKNKIKQLVKHNCASYLGDRHGTPNYCCWKGGSCVFFQQDTPLPGCRYFEDGVLPTDEKLERDYKSERNMDTEVKTAKPKVKCKKCGDSFSVNSNRQAYCEQCREKTRKENIRSRVRKLRQKRLDVTL